jgi:tRNA(fMet)-specific endonuclease VapC
MLYVLDTDTAIWIIRAREPFLTHFRAESPADIAISSMTLAELHFGVLKSPNPAASQASLSAFLSAIPEVLPFSEDAARIHAQLRHATRHQPIGDRDLVIASTAAAHGLTLVTSNTREFSRLPGLQLADWSKA